MIKTIDPTEKRYPLSFELSSENSNHRVYESDAIQSYYLLDNEIRKKPFECSTSVFSSIPDTSLFDDSTSGWRSEHLFQTSAIICCKPCSPSFEAIKVTSLVFTDDVEQFISANHLSGYLQIIYEYMLEVFARLVPVSITRHADPELGDEYIALNGTITAPVEELLEKYDLLCEKIAGTIPTSIRQQVHLSLIPA